jgi:hypothetical protein
MELACFEPCAVGTCFAPDKSHRHSLYLVHGVRSGIQFDTLIDSASSALTRLQPNVWTATVDTVTGS